MEYATTRYHKDCPDCKRPIADKIDEGDHNTGACGCDASRGLCWREWSPDGLCRKLSMHDPDHDDETNPAVPRTAVLDLVKSLLKGPCSCRYDMGSCTVAMGISSGETNYHYDRGPRTHHCMRCRAREALERDNYSYEKDDRQQWEPWMLGNVNVNAAGAISLGNVITGSVSFHNQV